MRKSVTFVYILLLLSLLSCAQKEGPQTREQALSKGYAMLDRHQYDEAIDYFANLAQKDSHYHVKLAWASAYAARAGVKIETIYAFVTAKNAEVAVPLQIQGFSLDQQARDLLKGLNAYAAVWSRIPSVNQSARSDLQSAVNILKNDDTPGVRLYSAALRAVILKSSVDEGVRNWNLVNRRKICVHDIKPYWDWALRVLESLTQFSEDLQGAFPSRQEITDAHLNLERLRAQAVAVQIPSEDQCF